MHALLLAFCCTVHGARSLTGGAPLSGAHVALHGPKTYTQVTDHRGNASFSPVAGTYNVDTAASGYTGVSIDLFLRDSAAVDVTLEPLDAPTLRTIGTVTVDGRLTPIRGVIPSVTVTRADMDRLGDNRVVDALMALPGQRLRAPMVAVPRRSAWCRCAVPIRRNHWLLWMVSCSTTATPAT